MQASSHVDYMNFNDLDFNSILNIGVKGTFKPIKNQDKKECEQYEKIDNTILNKVSCPYENEDGTLLPTNCKYADKCKYVQESIQNNEILGVNNKEKVNPKPKRGRPSKKQK